MKRFSFRLEKLLNLARVREEEARAAMAARLADVRAAEELVESARERVQTAGLEIARTLKKQRLEPRQIDQMHRWLKRAEDNQKNLEARLAQEELAFQKARGLMAERRKELVGFERARDDAREEWRAEANREEAAWMEEIASFRHLLKESES